MQDSEAFLTALRNVDTHGDVAPAALAETPSNFTMRHRAEMESLIAWNSERGRYVLTATGRARLCGRSRPAAAVLSFQAARRARRP